MPKIERPIARVLYIHISITQIQLTAITDYELSTQFELSTSIFVLINITLDGPFKFSYSKKLFTLVLERIKNKMWMKMKWTGKNKRT